MSFIKLFQRLLWTDSNLLCMPSCISKYQSAFVTLQCHSFKNKKDGKTSSFALKLDMAKAYDRVEWNFLEKMVFHSKWVKLIMKCITSVSYAAVVNRTITDSFEATRGLRQGDPLSPYLFLIFTGGFSALLQKAQTENFVEGVRACKGGPWGEPSFFFADDSLIFANNRNEECYKIAEIIKLYEDASKQLVNFTKSALMVSTRMETNRKQVLKDFFGVQSTSQPKKYFGLPTIFEEQQKESFHWS